MIDGWHGGFPKQYLVWNLSADISGTRSHIAMRQLEPGLGEGEFKFLRVLKEALRDFPIARVELDRKVGCQHDGRISL
jgi:hypothetical protein